jgi:hypothetical protein
MTVSILKCEEEIMWALLLVAIVLAYLILKGRETFVIKYGNPFDGEDALSFDRDAKGTRLFSTTPDTCPLDRPELDAGLCYEACEEGYHGVGPVCWANTQNIGPGMLAEAKPCSEMGLGTDYRDDPLTCWKDLKCTTYCDGNWDWSDGGFCHTRCTGPDLKLKGLRCPGRKFQLTFLTDLLGDVVNMAGGDGGKLKTNLDNYTELIDALCYKKCPEDKPNHVPGMPYLCMKGSRGLSYGRGVGTVPPLFHFGA